MDFYQKFNEMIISSLQHNIFWGWEYKQPPLFIRKFAATLTNIGCFFFPSLMTAENKPAITCSHLVQGQNAAFSRTQYPPVDGLLPQRDTPIPFTPTHPYTPSTPPPPYIDTRRLSSIEMVKCAESGQTNLPPRTTHTHPNTPHTPLSYIHHHFGSRVLKWFIYGLKL